MPSALTIQAERTAGIVALRRELQGEREALKTAYYAKPDAARLLKGLALATDRALRAIWADAGVPKSLALLAVGGYGRGELYPYSDVDLLILLPGKPDERETVRLEQLVGVLWDLGLEVGHSVRSIDDCL